MTSGPNGSQLAVWKIRRHRSFCACPTSRAYGTHILVSRQAAHTHIPVSRQAAHTHIPVSRQAAYTPRGSDRGLGGKPKGPSTYQAACCNTPGTSPGRTAGSQCLARVTAFSCDPPGARRRGIRCGPRDAGAAPDRPPGTRLSPHACRYLSKARVTETHVHVYSHRPSLSSQPDTLLGMSCLHRSRRERPSGQDVNREQRTRAAEA